MTVESRPERIRAVGAVLRDGDAILLVRRRNEPGAGRWTVPGGKVEPGETLPDAAAREVREETGLIVRVGAEVFAGEVLGPPGVVFEVHDFAATVTGGRLAAGDDAADARWFRVGDLDDVALTDGLLVALRRSGCLD